MVAIVSGNSLGLSLTSITTGQNGMAGSAALGRQGQRIYVNGANGNLVVQKADDHLSSRGGDLFALRTYNSRGTVDGDGNNDGWRLGFFRSVDSLTGVINTRGSTITRVDADGARAVYCFEGGEYVSTDGVGAHDTLSFDAAAKRWRWIDGTSRTIETFDWNDNSGKLLQQTDASGNAIDFVYVGQMLTEVRAPGGEKQVLQYTGRNLSEIRTVRQDGSVSTRVRYGYDDRDRLSSVIVDLTPEDNNIADGNTYVTGYRYHGDSNRIAGILESDGTQASFTYRQVGVTWMIDSMTQVVDGVARKTGYDYEVGTAAGTTTRITDALGQVTIVNSDILGRLVRIEGPPINGASQSASYTYNAAGDMLTQTDALGKSSRFTYDSRGNQTYMLDRMGQGITRTFDSNNQVVSERVTVASALSIVQILDDTTTFYVYDPRNRLRFTLSHEKRVTEFRYDGAGNQTSVIAYAAQTYSGSDRTEAALAHWSNAITDKSTIQITDYTYDFRGQVASITSWASVSTAGVGLADGSEAITRMVYDQSGQLLQTIAGGVVTSRTYDGLGRTLSVVDNTGMGTTAWYDDVGRRVISTQSDGIVSTSVYNNGGELISVLTNDRSGARGEDRRFWYDAGGRLRLVQNADGTKRALMYDAAGRQTGEIDALGRLTEFKINVNGAQVQSITYANLIAPRAFMASAIDLRQPSNDILLQEALNLDLESVRPAATTSDAKTWNVYDANERLAWQIDGLGYATQTLYDGQSRVVASTRVATALDVTQFGDVADIIINPLDRMATSLKLAESGTPIGPNGARTYIATLTAADSYAAAQGTVSFFAGSMLLGSAKLFNSVAALTVANLPVGQSDITAVYSGDTINAGSASEAIVAMVAPANPSRATLDVSNASTALGEPLNLTARIEGESPSGVVAFYDGAVTIGYAAVNNGAATLSLATLPAGLHSLTARYLGDAHHSASTTQAEAVMVSPPPVPSDNREPSRIVVTSSASKAAFGAAVVLRAEVIGKNPAGKIIFLDSSGKEIGQAAIVSGAASISVDTLPAGRNAITAMYVGDSANSVAVATCVQDVAQAQAQIALAFAPGPHVQGTPLILTATVPRSGMRSATGEVLFFNGTTLIGRATLLNGHAALSVADLPVGANELSVRYAGDANYAASRTESVSEVTADARSATSLTMRADKSELRSGDKVILTATVHTRSGTPLTGMVTFFSRREVIGTALVLNGVATLETAYFSDTKGYTQPTAAFSGDDAHASSSTKLGGDLYVHPGVATPAVAGSPSSVVLGATPAALTYGGKATLRANVAVADAGHPPTGSVTFFNGAVILGSARVVDGVAEFTFAGFTAASTQITAVYSGDPYNAPTRNLTSPARTVTMTPVVIDPVLTVSRDRNEQKSPLTLSATVPYPSHELGALLDGTAIVEFYAGEKKLGWAYVVNGQAILKDIAPPTDGGGTFKAVFMSSSSRSRAYGSSPPVQLGTAAPEVPRLLLTASNDVEVVGTVRLSVALDFEQLSTYALSAGTISFYDGDLLLGNCSVADGERKKSLTLTGIPIGTHQYRAVYAPTRPDNAMAYSPPLSHSDIKPTPRMQFSEVAVDAQGLVVPWSSKDAQFARITIEVGSAATGVAAATGTLVIDHRRGDVRLGSAQVVDGRAVLLVPFSALRQDWSRYDVYYSGDGNNAAAHLFAVGNHLSGPNLSSPTDIHIVLSSRPVPAARNEAVELYVNVNASDPTGTVTFYDAYRNVLGVSPVVSGTASLVVSGLPDGLAGVTAQFVGGKLSTSTTATYRAPGTASLATTRTSLSTSAYTSALDSPLVLTARVSGAAVGPGGTVTFYDGSALLGTVLLQDGVAVWTGSTLDAGLRQLTAVYSGDAANASSVSGAVDTPVMGAPVTVRMEQPAEPVRQGAPVTYRATVEGVMPGGIVTFVSGRTVLGMATLVRGVATLQLQGNGFDIGEHDIIASYAGDTDHAAALSVAVKQQVTAGVKQVNLARSLSDRRTANFLDGDGQVRVTIDAEMFVTEHFYDGAKRLVKTIAYAQPYKAPHLLPDFNGKGSFKLDAAFMVTMPKPSAADRTTHFFYDNAGRTIADVNAEGFLSEYSYDSAGRLTGTVRYANSARGPVDDASTPASLRPVSHAEDQHSRSAWDASGNLIRRTSADGTVAEFSYDSAGRLTGTTSARGTEDQRATLRRYDGFGRLQAELDAVGTARIVGQQSVTEIDAIWSAHGTSYTYDAIGKLTTVSAPLGMRTIMFYDEAGQLRHTVNGMGEVTENEYDALGRLVTVTQYGGRVRQSDLSAMAGGSLAAAGNHGAALALQAARSAKPEKNSAMRLAYDLAGQVVARTDAMDGVSTMVYNAFGEVISATGAGASAATRYQFDRRGLETARTTSTEKLFVTARVEYDAFGRAIRSVDGNGNVRQTVYDRLGQIIHVVDPATGRQSVTYDAFGRELTETDSLKNVTRYRYDTAARSMSVTSAEGVTATTVATRNGQVRTLTDGNGNTTSYRYDANGNVLEVTTPVDSAASRYDAANRLVLSSDGAGREVVYTYDAASRLLTRTVDPEGAALRTHYEYDAKGQAVRVTDPAGRVTTTRFDLNGNTIAQTIDAEGVPSTTTYTHDAGGRIVTILQQGGHATQYVYDELGRRIHTIADPAGLHLVDSFKYDKNGNVVARVDGSGNRTLYVYDALDRVVFEIDPTGNVRQNVYDLEGRMVRTVAYARPIDLARIGEVPSRASVAAQLALTPARDIVIHRVYDQDGRLAFEVDATGGVQAYRYDGNGNATTRLSYANRIDMGAWIVGSVPAPVADAARDLLVRTVYDALDRPVFAIDALGRVVQMTYGEDGNVSERVSYANPIGAGTAATYAAVAAALVPNAALDVHNRYVYDALDRVILKVDTLGNVEGYSYDAYGNVIKAVDYHRQVAAGDSPASVQPSVRDRVSLMAYDAEQRLTFKIDATGQLSARSYDGNGNVVKTVVYANRIVRPTAASATLDHAAMAALIVGDEARDRVAFSVFDGDNREIYSIDANGAVTARVFDAAGNVISRTAYASTVALGATASASSVPALVAGIADSSQDDRVRYVHDAAGRVLWSVNAAGDAVNYTYAATGQVTSTSTYLRRIASAVPMTAQALAAAVAGTVADARDDNVYDSANRLAYEIDSSGVVTSHQYDGNGLEIKRTVHAARIARTSFVAGVAPAVVSDSVRDSTLRTAYDSLGRAIFTVDRDGYVLALTYSEQGNLATKIAYGKRIDPAIAMSAAAIEAAVQAVADVKLDAFHSYEYDQDNQLVWESAAGKVTGYTYDADGNVVKKVEYAAHIPNGAAPHSVSASATDKVVLVAFDVHGRPVISIDHSGRVNTVVYDANGNAIERKTFANLAEAPTVLSAPIDESASLPAADLLNDRCVRTVYDTAGREIYRIDQAGAVVATRYDGNAVERISYASAVPPETPASAGALASTVAAVAASGKDRFERQVRDAAGRVVSSTDAKGRTTAFSYDAQGNLIATVSPEGAVARTIYDGHGRIRYSVDTIGVTTEYAYDVYGNAVRQVQFAQAIPVNGDPRTQSVAAQIDDRISLMAYDQRGQLIYAVDPEGAVRHQQFDSAGNMTSLTLFASKLASVAVASGAIGISAIDGMIVPESAADRVSRQVFDASNRLIYSIDPMGYVRKYEYDAQGNLTAETRYSRTVLAGGAFTDFTVAGLDGRLVSDPARDQVDRFDHNSLGQVIRHQDATGRIETIRYNSIGQKIGFTDKNGGDWTYQYDAAGNLSTETAPEVPGKAGGAYRRIVDFVYDALGQLLVRSASGDGEQRVQRYSYDSAGNQVTASAGGMSYYAPGFAGTQQSGEVASSRTYNARGQVLSSVDAEGYVSRNVYDHGGRLRFEIDAKGNVTSYLRNSFGDVTSLTRYEVAISIDPVTSPSVAQVEQALAALDPAQRRTITTTYDRAGRVLQVTQPASDLFDSAAIALYAKSMHTGSATRNTYDAFGAIIQQAHLLNAHSGTWAVHNSYYDQRGMLSARVDAGGYLTSYNYDSAGNLIRTTESAVAIAGWTGNRQTPATAVTDTRDRVMSSTYDRQNRVVRESRSEGSAAPDNEHVRVTEYDGLGNVIMTKAWGPGASDSDAPHRFWRDAFGRVTAAIDGNHPVGNGFGLTHYRYNLAGQVVSETAYANGSVDGSSATPAATSAEDRTRTVEYDEQGHPIHIVDAEGVSQYLSYNLRGLQTASWHVGDGRGYAQGEIVGLATRTYDALGRLLTDTGQDTVMQYNSYGELVRRQQGSQVTTWEFDSAGHMWRSNESGTDEISLYDMLGRKTATVRADGREEPPFNNDIKAIASAADVKSWRFARRTEFMYDANSNLTAIFGAQRDGLIPVTRQIADRWGNVLSKTEPAPTGTAPPTTTYTYDVQNRITSERYPKADGTPGGRVRELRYVEGAQGAMAMRVTVDRENASVTGPENNDAMHAVYRVTHETFTAGGKLLSSTTNGILAERHTYDVFDQLRSDEMQADRVVRYDYDRTSHVTSIRHQPVDVYGVSQGGPALTLESQGSMTLEQRYRYDELGNLQAYTNGAGEVTRYRHDSHGRLTWSQAPGSAPSANTWDAGGRKLSSTDALGNVATWRYDSYGRVVAMIGFDGAESTYTYDIAGQLSTVSQPAKGQTQTYSYDKAGRLIGIDDVTTAVNGYQALTRTTVYGYDLADNRVFEKTIQDGRQFEAVRSSYDAFHRLYKVVAEGSGEGAQTISYQHDGFGNRVSFFTQAPRFAKGIDRNQTGHFFYDALNRMVVSGALDANGAVGLQTIHHAYDSAGNLASTIAGGRTTEFDYDAMNRVVSTSINGSQAFATHYDAAGRVVADGVELSDAPAIPAGMPRPVEPVEPVAPTPPPVGSTAAVMDRYRLQQDAYAAAMVLYSSARDSFNAEMKDYLEQSRYLAQLRVDLQSASFERHLKAYDDQGRLVIDQAFKDDDTVKSMMVNEQFDSAGNVLRYRTESMVGDHVRIDYINRYRTLTNAVKQSESSGRMTILSGKMAGDRGANATTASVYDANGYLIGVNYATQGDAPQSGTSNKVFIVDASGNILLSRERSHNSPTSEQRQIIVNGELQLRYSDSYGGFGDLDDALKQAFWDAYNDRASQSMVSAAGATAVAAGANSTTGQVVIVGEGDTLQSIATRVYGTPHAWYRIADANDLGFDSVLVTGQSVVAPAAVADSKKLDFDLGKVIGSTAPNVPPPAVDQNCLSLAIIAVVIVVAYVIAPYMAPMATAMLGSGASGMAVTVAAGAMQAAIVNVAAQAVAVAANVQVGMDWKAVGLAAVGGGIGASMGFSAMDGWTNGAANSAITQAIGVATGLQKKFSWVAVASAAVAAEVSVRVDTGVKAGDFGEFLKTQGTQAMGSKLLRGGLTGFASSLTTDLLRPANQNWSEIGMASLGGALNSAFSRPSFVAAAMSGRNESAARTEGDVGAIASPVMTGMVSASPGISGAAGVYYEDAGIEYLDSLRASPSRSSPVELGAFAGKEAMPLAWDPALPVVFVPGKRLTEGERAASRQDSFTTGWNPFTMTATLGKYAVGGTEVLAGGIYNGFVRGLAGVASVPALLDSADAAIAVQQVVADRFSYGFKSAGAKRIGDFVQPAARYLSGKLDELRDYSERHIGVGPTSLLFATTQVGIEVAGMLSGSRGLQALLRLEAGATASGAAAAATLTGGGTLARLSGMLTSAEGKFSAAGTRAARVTIGIKNDVVATGGGAATLVGRMVGTATVRVAKIVDDTATAVVRTTMAASAEMGLNSLAVGAKAAAAIRLGASRSPLLNVLLSDGPDALKGLLPGRQGHAMAKRVHSGGSGSALSGHGAKYGKPQDVLVPEGTAITLPRANHSIKDFTGRMIERGDWDAIADLAKNDREFAADIQGMTTWLPGSKVPDYTLLAPNKSMEIYSASHTVASATRLSEMLKPNLGCIQWAACTVFK